MFHKHKPLLLNKEDEVELSSDDNWGREAKEISKTDPQPIAIVKNEVEEEVELSEDDNWGAPPQH